MNSFWQRIVMGVVQWKSVVRGCEFHDRKYQLAKSRKIFASFFVSMTFMLHNIRIESYRITWVISPTTNRPSTFQSYIAKSVNYLNKIYAAIFLIRLCNDIQWVETSFMYRNFKNSDPRKESWRIVSCRKTIESIFEILVVDSEANLSLHFERILFSRRTK